MKGLTSKKAEELLKQYGLNVIKEQNKTPLWRKFFEQFNNFLTLLLIGAAVLSLAIGEMVDGILILAIVILNAIFGLYQETKAEESIAALKQMTATKIRVVRDGKELEIDSRYLVPGDLIYVEEGVKVPADCRAIETVNLEINEAALTGESLPVAKKNSDEIFSGTIVAKGRGRLEVMKTGMMTKFGQIAKNLSIIDEATTPLQKKLQGLTRLIGIIGIIISLIVFFLSIFHGDGYFPGFLLAVSLAVAIVPEGLPAVMTITLAIGVKEMAKKKSIIRRLSAIEALGSITLIATDKTGTLTTNKMKVKEVYVDKKNYSQNQLPSLSNRAFSFLVLNGILCSTASLVEVHDHGSWDVLGDPTEGALLYLGQEVGLIPQMVREEWKVVEEKPFDSVSKMMSVIVKNVGRSFKPFQTIQFSKGAPESILAICDKILIGHQEKKLTADQRYKIKEQVERWAKKGLRVLAFSYKGNPKSQLLNSKQQTDSKQFGNWKLEIEASQVLLGMVAIHDAPRPEVVEAVKKAKEAGIKIVMITGDNEKTAESIGVHTGIINYGDEIITGEQIDKHTDQDLLKILPKVKIFARTNPFQKHRIVKLYQQLGEVIAVTGDGVNDAIALKQADVGVAMGLVGTDVARETADMVITDDNFATIVNAIEEGRNIIKNLKNAVKYLLSCNIIEAISLIGGLVFGIRHLFYPIQLLYVNLITDGLPALSLAFSPKDSRAMNQPPEEELTVLKPFDIQYIFLVGLWGTVLVLGGFFIYYWLFNGVSKTAAFTILVLIQPFILVDLWLTHRHLHTNIEKLFKPIFAASFLFPFIIQFFIVRFPDSAAIFRITPVSIFFYLQFVIITSLVLVGVKGIKKIIN